MNEREEIKMFARYKVIWSFDGQECVNRGYVQGHSYAEAVQKIEASYDYIESIEIRWISDSNNCLDDDDIEDADYDKEEQIGAGPQLFETIKQGAEEAIAYERLEADN
jgi:hypothetical protein